MTGSQHSIDKEFGKVLKKKRVRRGLSQEKLAEYSNLTRAYISQLENGSKDPSLFTIVKLSLALKIKPSVFIDEVEHSF
jgi:transcriptional regulator with XRE-family HTH domain